MNRDAPYTIMGQAQLPGQEVDEVLGRFGRREGEARQSYETFIADGVAQGN